MDEVAARLDDAADALSDAERSVPRAAVSADVFGAAGAGRPGRLGRVLHAHWAAVLDARAREAAEVAHRLATTASEVRTTARWYADTDDAAARRLHREA